MRKIFAIVLGAVLIVSANAEAGVRFITDVPQNTVQGKLPSVPVKQQSKRRCQSAGYSQTVSSCGTEKVAVRPCPHDARYFKACCDKEYAHTKKYCLSRGLTPSRRSCEGMYACE